MEGAVYLGTEQFITMAVVLSVAGTVLVFLLKHWFGQVNGGISGNSRRLEQIKEELQEELQRNNEKVNERIDHIEERTNQDIAELRQGMSDLKGDFAATFVQRDDFFRYMNGMETNIKDTNNKVDKILMLITDRRNGKNGAD